MEFGLKKGPRVFISAAEPSGDLYGAFLIREVRRRRPQAQFVGVAGPAMQAEGCRAIYDMTGHAAMLLGVLGSAGRAMTVLSRTTGEFCGHRYDAAVVIDSPMLHLPVALRAKMRAIPVLYYVAPQLWAWGESRIHKVRARVDELAVILPFEKEYFENLGLQATYVGHPLFDALTQRTADSDLVARIRSLGRPRIAILPGSRKHVVREVLPGQLQVARAICDRFPRAHVGISVASSTVADTIRRQVDQSRCSVTLYPSPNTELLRAADLALVASGTATLEVAHYGCPMIVMYNGSRLMYHLVGRWMVRLKDLSLINILAGRRLVPEFMPYYNSTVPIAQCAIDLLSSSEKLHRMAQDLRRTIAPIRRPGASARTADLLLQMIDAAAH